MLARKHRYNPVPPSSNPDRTQHDRVIAELETPPWLAEGDLLSDHWICNTEDPNGLLRRPIVIDFSLPINPGPVRLNDRGHEHDHLTAKLFFYYSLSTADGWNTSALSSRQAYFDLIDLIRWRESAGLRRIDQLRPIWFEQFQADLSGPTSHFLPYWDRIEAFIQNIRLGLEELPLREGGSRLAANKVAERLGLVNTLQIPRPCWARFLNFIKETRPDIYDRTVYYRQRDDFLSEEAPGYEPVNGRIYSRLRTWEVLWKLRHRLHHDPVRFRPIDPGTTTLAIARGISSKVSTPTPEPPPYQVCFLINEALKMTLSQAAALDAVFDVVRVAGKEYPEGGKVGFRLRNEVIRKEMRGLRSGVHGTTLSEMKFLDVYAWRKTRLGETRKGTELRQLLFVIRAAAAAIIIAAIGARRHQENQSLRDDCLYEDAHGNQFMSVWIEKSLRDIDGIPVTQSVVRAVEVLRTLSADARHLRESKWLFEFVEPDGSGHSVAFNMTDAVRIFAEYVGVPPLPDGTYWNFTAQQFRSFFALTYYHRWSYPSLTALSLFMRHYNPDTTRAYVTATGRGNYIKIADERNAREKKGPKKGL